MVRIAKSLVFMLLVSMFLFWTGSEVAGAILGVAIVVSGGMLGKSWYAVRGLSEEEWYYLRGLSEEDNDDDEQS